MSDPLSITASVVDIIIPALHGTRLLLQGLQQLKDAPKTVKRLVEDVRSVDKPLELLQAVEDIEWDLLGARDLFRTDLQRWTRHSKDGKLAWQDRISVGFFKQGQIKTMSEQLSNCKLAINSLVSIATLYSSVRHSHITEEIMKIISTKQAEVKSAIITADKQLAVLENKLGELNISSDDEEAAGFRESKSEASRQVEEGLKAVKASQKLLDELLSKSQKEAVAKAAGNQSHSITVTFGNQISGFQARTIGGGFSEVNCGGK